MQKTFFTLVFIIITNYIFSQQSNSSEGKTYDSKLVGCWKGSEINQQMDGISKYWVACRFENGTSTLLFIAIDKNGEVTQETENGKWWVENGKYYELNNYDKKTDIYDYEIVDGSTVNFKSIELMGKKNNTYTFSDYKIEED
jgi:hypothetical protein